MVVSSVLAIYIAVQSSVYIDPSSVHEPHVVSVALDKSVY